MLKRSPWASAKAAEILVMQSSALRGGLICVLVASWLSPQRLAAQDITEITGVVKAIQGNRLEVQSGDERHIVVVDGPALKEAKQKTTIEFHGRGRASILQRGQWVRFYADLDATGKVVGPLQQLTWFTPQRYTQEGAFPAEAREGGGEPLVHWDRPLRGEIAAGPYLVVGSVRSVQSGALLVVYLEGQGRERQVLAELAPDVDVEIDISNRAVAGKLIRPGDAVEVRGRASDKQLQAQSIVVRREEVLGKELATPSTRPLRKPRSEN